jgi:hypothetical protein
VRAAARTGQLVVLGLLAQMTVAAVPAPPPADPVAPLRQQLEVCRSRLNRELDVGYERIAARCPDLTREVEANGVGAWLPRGWRDAGNGLSAGSLEELRTLLARELDSRAQSRAPSVPRLHQVLARLGDAAHTRSGVWSRLQEWLRQVTRREDDPRTPEFLARLLNRVGVSARVIEVVSYGCLAAVMALAALIIANELRAAGVRLRLPGRPRSTRPGPPPSPELAPLAQLDAAALEERPRLLLAVLLERLSRQGRLPPARSLTVGEVTRGARLPGPADEARLTELASTAECVRYSNALPIPTRLQAALAGGRTLLERLEVGTRAASRTQEPA